MTLLLATDQVQRILNGENPIRVIREHLGLTLRQLCLRTGIDRKLLQEIEAGYCRGAGRASAGVATLSQLRRML